MTALRTRRRGGRDARRKSHPNRIEPMLGYLTRGLPFVEPLTFEQIKRIDDESMRILEEVGVVFRDPIALEDWKKAGARVDGERVYFDRAQIKELIATIPSDITLHARDPQKTVKLGGSNSIFVPTTGAPYIRDLNDVRRDPIIADLHII